MWSVLIEVTQDGFELDLSFPVFGFQPISINIQTIFLINFGKQSWSFPVAIGVEERILQDLMISQDYTLIILGTIHKGLHEDMQMLKLGGDVGPWDCHLFASIFIFIFPPF